MGWMRHGTSAVLLQRLSSMGYGFVTCVLKAGRVLKPHCLRERYRRSFLHVGEDGRGVNCVLWAMS